MNEALTMPAAGRGQAPDERLGLLAFLSYVLWLLFITDLPALGIVIGVMLAALAWVSPAPQAVFLRWARGVPAAVVVVLLFWIFAPEETPSWLTVLGKSFGPQGLWQGTFFAARFMGFLLGAFFLYEISTPEHMARAVLWFAAPLRVVKAPIHLLYYIIWFAMRSIPVLAQEARIITLAQQARGARLANPKRWWSTDVLALVIPVFAAAARRSDRFATALEARGFSPAEHYRSRPMHPLATRDGLWIAGLVIGWAVFAFWRWGSM